MNPDEIAKLIPPEVQKVLTDACNSGEPWNVRDTIAAMLSAWPGAELDERMWPDGTDFLILPLPKEKSE